MVSRIQQLLENLYGIECSYRAEDFLVDDQQAKSLGSTGRAPEELLVHEADDGLDVALYLDADLLQRVSRYEARPLEAVQCDLSGFCEVAEGVSHFVYLTRSAGLDRKVSLLELEAQAEVDKFAVCTVLQWGHDVRQRAEALVSGLFDRIALRPGLSESERWRYTEANRLAKRFASTLSRHIRNTRLDGLLAELRHAYRLGAEAKLAYFAR
jgi:hypothetical protein